MSETSVLPVHVGIILDGNRRWAKAQGLPVIQGHRKGMDVLKDVSLYAFERGVRYLSAYVFSTENWQRTEEEVTYLMDLTIKAVERYLDEFHQKNVRIVILGRREGVSKKVLEAIDRAEQKTKDNSGGTLALCFNYGGKEELVDAVRHIVEDGADANTITAETISSHLYGADIPEIDLLVRTSGERRTSGFMLYRAAYAELKFIDKNWPDFTIGDFEMAIKDYAERERRFGA